MPEYAEFSNPLADAVFKAREALKLTQSDIANKIEIDPRTILNIENRRGNPKMEVLYPLIRTLHIDPREIFYPEVVKENPNLQKLQMLISDCSETEAQALIPVIQSVLSALRADNVTEIE